MESHRRAFKQVVICFGKTSLVAGENELVSGGNWMGKRGSEGCSRRLLI
jgi:hypothetical protein